MGGRSEVLAVTLLQGFTWPTCKTYTKIYTEEKSSVYSDKPKYDYIWSVTFKSVMLLR